jgi:putative SOS response-associated peptidase YedK
MLATKHPQVSFLFEMCTNYIPVTSAERLLQFFGVVRGIDEPSREVFPAGLAPFIRLAPDGTDSGELVRTVADGIFRFVPDFIAKVEWARNTYNARCETVDTKSTYKKAWAEGHRCIIPSEAFYEPNYGSGGPVRWRICKANGEPMGIAGICRKYSSHDGQEMFAFSMLTVNADDHPFMKQFHAPSDEKRMVVILEPTDFEGWLTYPITEAKERFCKQWSGDLVGEPAPLPKRPKKSPPIPPQKPTDPTGDLF